MAFQVPFLPFELVKVTGGGSMYFERSKFKGPERLLILTNEISWRHPVTQSDVCCE